MEFQWPVNYGDPEWFVYDRFGLFIHWGLYSLAARHEWVMNREKIHPDEYRKYFTHFNPDLFDPQKWARAAKNAGMKYFVITTKHHEGFALWDSKVSDYKVTNTPYGRDLIGPMVEAFRNEGLKVGFYHSLIDWHHPEFPIDGLHPQREDESFKAAAQNRDISKYAQYLKEQVRELLTDYGKIDYLWFDFSYQDRDWGWSRGKGKDDWNSQEIEDMIFELQPDIVLNDRMDLGRGIVTPEQFQPQEVVKRNGQPVIWEACQTLNGSWGYDRDNLDWKSVDLLVKMLVDTVSKGGNLLLNVGPNARGEFDQRSLNALEGIGEWMHLHSRSIYGAGYTDLPAPCDCRYTRNGDRLYLHIFSWPFKHIYLKELGGKVEYAQFLHDASEVNILDLNGEGPHSHVTPPGMEGVTVLEIPVQKPNVVVPVIELFLKEER
ncbi:alpha-L-fucosidase [Alicyclobacillus fastidiosus]|uniref:alpha-L-fucosidase n=1 Tax=Alicyclobacillus fastidiosus TaxID=392011 RepID=A0ABY6ZCA8_9BACL|nr:alpha-L-fucosidase [Alicyclobacillus fastidiosus]WAH39839.1 alpha-L-fucosidase [Alicyclobacillus fastidiosus]GMA61095.1 alpha-L-fucosidase [Alicyclobacillus fastidiosus]